MATTITPVQQTHVSSCLLIDLTLDNTTYYISSAYKPVTYDRIRFFPTSIRLSGRYKNN